MAGRYMYRQMSMFGRQGQVFTKEMYLGMSVIELKRHKMTALLNKNYTLSNDLEIIILAKETDQKLSGAEDISGDYEGLGLSGEDLMSGDYAGDMSGELGQLNALFRQANGG